MIIITVIAFVNDFDPMQMARVCWWFYFSKVIELADTVSKLSSLLISLMNVL